MRKAIISLLFFLSLQSCKENDIAKNVNFDGISFQVNNNWKIEETRAVDVKSWIMITEVKDTIKISKGKGTYNVKTYEEDYIVLDSLVYKNLLKNNGLDGFKQNIKIYGNGDLRLTTGILDNSYALIDTLSDRTVKIVLPKLDKIGMTGVYIPSINSNGDSFSMYLKKSDNKSAEQLLEVFKTMKIKE